MGESVVDLARRARAAGLSGNFGLGHQILDEAAVLAGADDGGLAWIAIERGRLYNSAGAPDEARPLFSQAWDLARHAGDHDLAVDAAHMLAIVSDVDGAAGWVATALGYIEAHGASPQWRGMLHHNLGWTYFEADRFEEALASFRKDEAIALGEHVVALADAANDTAPYVCEELAECYALKGEAAAAQRFAGRAHAILSDNASFVQDEPVRLARLAALCAGEVV